jgi:hypothetical protein
MKVTRTILIALGVLALVSSASAATRGWGLGGSVFDGDFGVQLRKDVWLGGDVSQFTAQGAIYFHDRTTFRVDADYHFVVNPGNPGRFYPLAGLDLAFNSDHAKFGLNVGGGANFMLTEKTAAFGEVKYVIGDWDGWVFTGGIYF